VWDSGCSGYPNKKWDPDITKYKGLGKCTHYNGGLLYRVLFHTFYYYWDEHYCSLCADQFESSTSPPPGQPSGHLNFWRLACSNSLHSGQESCSNAPPISTELPLLKDKFGLQSSTLHAVQRKICCNDTFNLLLKTLFKELFTNKGKILSCKSVRPRKNRKNSRAYYVRTSGKSGSNSPPFQWNVQIPPSPGTMHSQMPGVCPGGGMLKFRIDPRIILGSSLRRGSLYRRFTVVNKWEYQPVTCKDTR